MAQVNIVLFLSLLGHAVSFMMTNVKYRNSWTQADIQVRGGLCTWSAQPRLRYSRAHSVLTTRMCDSPANEKVDEVDLIKIFGRIAEKTLFGDGSAGQCCHSGCSDCEWRYSFDILQSARPKWIPTYRCFIFTAAFFQSSHGARAAFPSSRTVASTSPNGTTSSPTTRPSGRSSSQAGLRRSSSTCPSVLQGSSPRSRRSPLR